MHINIEHHDKSFNVALSSKQGADPFLVVKGCRIVDGQKGRFVSWPSKKLDSGKYWNHCFSSDAFSAAVIKAHDESIPKPAAKKSAAAAASTGFVDDMDDDIPFAINALMTEIKSGKSRRMSRADF